MGTKLDATLAILNGLVGDHLVRTNNALATPLSFVHDGAPIAAAALATALDSSRSRVVVLVHGLMCTETVFRLPDGSDYGTLLERDLGFTSVRVRYNTGVPIAETGAALAAALAELHAAWPVPVTEIMPVGFSMGGLVVRAACHTATLEGQPWVRDVHRAVYCGTPHRGAPLERAGRIASRFLRAVPDPYTRLLADIADLRSGGLRDLGDADLRHEDRTRPGGLSLRDPRHPVPLLATIDHFLAAGSIDLLFGDAIVPVASAIGDACSDEPLPRNHIRVFDGYSHVRLAHDLEVYDQIRRWCAS